MTKWSDENKDKARKLMADGQSIRDISKELGISKSAVHSFFKKAEPVRLVEENTFENNITIEYKDRMEINDSAAKDFMSDILSTKEVEAPPNKKAESFLKNLMENVEAPAPKSRKKAEVKEVLVERESDSSLKGELIAKITMNVNNFEPLLKDFVKPNKESFLSSIYKKSPSELESLLKTLETTRSVANMSNQFLHFFWLGSGMVELGSPHIGLDTTGLTMALRQQQDEIQMIMKEICLDKVDSFKKIQKPEYRLAMILTTTAIGISTQNQMRKLQTKTTAPPKRTAETKPPEPVKVESAKIELKTPTLHKTLIPEEEKEQFNDL